MSFEYLKVFGLKIGHLDKNQHDVVIMCYATFTLNVILVRRV